MSLTSRCAQLQDIIKAQGPVSADGYSFMGSNLLKTTILGGTFTPETYQSSVFTTCAPWIIVAALSLAVYLIFLTNAIWLRNCPQKATGLWACCRLPRNRAHTKPLLVIGLFLCTGALAASIAGVIVGGSNKDNGDKAACALIDYLDRVRNGSMSQNWGGTNKSLSTYNKLRDDYTTAITNALALKNSFVTVTTALDAQLLLYQGDLDMLYNARANYKVKSAKAASTATIDPDFITKLGPSTLSGTYLYKLKTESDTLKTTVVDAATYLSNNVKNLDLAGQATVTSGAASFSYFTNALDSVTPLIRNYITENYDRWVNIVNGVSVSLYVCIGLSALIVLAISYHHFYRSQLAIQIAYISWNFLMLWTVVNAVFASQMQVFKKRSLEHCDVFNLVATNKDFVGQLVGFRPVTLTSCMFSTGTTYDTVGITSQVDALGKIAYYIRSVSPYLVTAAGSLEIASQKKVLDNYIQGLLPANSDLTNDDGTSTNMIRFNDYSNSAAAGNLQSKDAQCSISKDTWVLNLTNCGTTLPFSPAYGPADYFGQPICLSILSLDSGSITRRYNDAAFTGCALVGGDKIADILVADYNALNTHFEDTRIKLGQLKRFYDNNLNFKYNQTVISAYSITQPIVDFNSSVSGYLDYIAGATHGVLNNSNCAFFKNDLLSANTFLCNTATGLEKTFITHVVAVACSAVGCVFVYLYLRKLEGTFRLVSNKEDSDLEEIAHSPIPRELQNLDASARGDNDRVLDDAEI